MSKRAGERWLNEYQQVYGCTLDNKSFESVVAVRDFCTRQHALSWRVIHESLRVASDGSHPRHSKTRRVVDEWLDK
jgi:hypothetical protein